MAGAAVLAYAAGLRERNDYTHPGFDGLDVLAHFFDHASEFVSEDCGQARLEADPSPVALPQMPVRTADAAGLDAHDRAVGRALRFRPVILDDHRLADFFPHHRFHPARTSFLVAL